MEFVFELSFTQMHNGYGVRGLFQADDAKLENLDSNSVSFDIDKRVEQMKGSLKQRMKDRVASYESNVEADDDTLEE